MPRDVFEFADSEAEQIARIQRALEHASLDAPVKDALTAIFNFQTWQRVSENRDDDLTSFLNSGLTVGAFHLVASTGTSAPTATATPMEWEAITLNTINGDAAWDAGDPTKLTLNTAGLWIITTNVRWTASSGGSLRATSLRVNGGSSEGGCGCPQTTSAPSLRNSVSYQHDATAGDYFETYLYQNSGSNKTGTGVLQAAFIGGLGTVV